MNDLISRQAAKPEQSMKIEYILNYLDTELHPIISPEHWNIYSELHDMIALLPSVEPERKTGKWIKANDGIDGHVQCTECLKTYDWDTQAQYYDFCPSCGAKMEEVNNEI